MANSRMKCPERKSSLLSIPTARYTFLATHDPLDPLDCSILSSFDVKRNVVRLSGRARIERSIGLFASLQGSIIRRPYRARIGLPFFMFYSPSLQQSPLCHHSIASKVTVHVHFVLIGCGED